jgi:hypothetical protein
MSRFGHRCTERSLEIQVEEVVGVRLGQPTPMAGRRHLLNLEAFRELFDPEVLEENQERFRREAKHYAEAIKTLRQSKGLEQGKSPV